MTALPGGGEDLGDGGLDALVGVGDDELDAAQAAPRQLPEEGGPEGLGLRRTDIHAQHFAPAIGIDADGDDDGDRHDAAGLADLQVGGVDPQIGPVALDRPVEERLHLAVPPHAASRMGWAQLGDAQLDGAGPCLPVALAIAVALSH